MSAFTALVGFHTGSPLMTAAQSADPAALLRKARRAEMEYESSIRRHAPMSFSQPVSRTCDEVVGRYCIYYESGGDTLPSEPRAVTAARDKAIRLLETAHESTTTSTLSLAFPLVRFLVRANRAAEAVRVARRAVIAPSDTASAHMLMGFALHAAGDTRAATAEFTAWLNALTTKERAHITNVRWLLDRRERSRYERLDSAQRYEYEVRLWRYADPLYLTEGNEAWADHMARHALARMLGSRRGIVNVDSWGEDLEQLTVRFGAPLITTRSWSSGTMGSEGHYSDHWDPSLRTYIPPVLADALELDARLDTIWPIDSLTARSGHAPPIAGAMHVLEHQAAVFSDQFTVTGVVRKDSLSVAGPRAALFLLDSALNNIAQADAVATPQGDSVVFTADIALYPQAAFYSAELHDGKARFAARARYRINLPKAGNELVVSSIVLAQPFEPGDLPAGRAAPELRPLTRPIITSGSRVGVYTEVTGAGQRRSIQVQIETSRLDRPSAIGRALGWIGEKVGLAVPRAPMRLGWTVELEPGNPNPLPVTLDLGRAEPGRYRLTVTALDPANGDSARAMRELLVVKAPK